jgi:hypothetical protein
MKLAVEFNLVFLAFFAVGPASAAYGATEELNLLRAKFPDYAYKEATLNPTNLRDRAPEWEADIVNRFRQYPKQIEVLGTARSAQCDASRHRRAPARSQPTWARSRASS